PEPGSNSPRKSMSLAHNLKRWLMVFYNRSHDKYCLLTLVCLVFKEQFIVSPLRSDFHNITCDQFDVNHIFYYFFRRFTVLPSGSAATFINITG
ncbi:hypothetical protein, partial [Mesobacillus sp.]|uniref:hypothetical protein n=1 Tax=Mesobacillus sp. TaxID=2675271 RepID=UPI0039F0CE2E